MIETLFSGNGMLWGGAVVVLIFILIFAYLRYSTNRFRTNVAFKHNEAGMDLLRKNKFTEAIREFELALGLDPNVEIFKNNIEIAKTRMIEAKNKEKNKIDSLGINYNEK